MKKTLFALTALLTGVAVADESWTLEQATPAGGVNGGNNYIGVQFNLGTALESGVAVLSNGEGSLPAELNLDTVTIQLRSNSGGVTRYLYLLDASDTVVGVSTESASGSAGAVLTFNFEGVTLSSSATYRAILTAAVSGVENYDDVTVGSTYQPGQYSSTSLASETVVSGGNANSFGILNASNRLPNLASTTYTPVMTIGVSTPAVPEPATATLSLLALAGLAARRRRALRAA